MLRMSIAPIPGYSSPHFDLRFFLGEGIRTGSPQRPSKQANPHPDALIPTHAMLATFLPRNRLRKESKHDIVRGKGGLKKGIKAAKAYPMLVVPEHIRDDLVALS